MNLLPLETLRAAIGYHPFHFWGLANATAPIRSNCNDALYQYAWQDSQQIGRADMLAAIETAERKLTDALGYAPAPRYVDVTQPYARYLNPMEWRANSADANGRWASADVHDGYIENVGVETLTSIGSANVTYSDSDGDGVNDTFVATIATSVTDADNIAVYFGAGDRLDSEPVGEKWRIQPVSVSISGGTATIRGRAWLLVKPLAYEGVSATVLDPSTSTNFVTSIAVYERKTNGDGTTTDTAQGVFTWETPPFPRWSLCCGTTNANYNGSSTDPASIATIIARVGIRDARRGLLIPGTAAYDASTAQWNAVAWGTARPPDTITLRYLAGYPLEGATGSKRMARVMQDMVVRLAIAEMARPICACDTANREWYRWQQDLARTNKDDELYTVSPQDLNNPFGTRRGHVWAWRQVLNLHQKRGVFPG